MTKNLEKPDALNIVLDSRHLIFGEQMNECVRTSTAEKEKVTKIQRGRGIERNKETNE